MENLLRELCIVSGVSGDELEISSLVKDKLSNFSDVTIENDKSVIAAIGPDQSKNHILFDAHLDQIGLIVTKINKNGFLKVAACGGVDPRILYGSTVIVHGQKNLTGIICSTPQHLKDPQQKEKFPEINDLFVDIGTSDEKIISYISIGDRILFKPNFNKLINNNFVSPSIDNRAGVCVMIKLVEQLYHEKLNTKITVLLSSREEVGGMGAKISAFKLTPDEAVAVDVSFAKQPGLNENKHGVIGDGPMVSISPSLSRDISDLLIDISQRNSIPYQVEAMGTSSGTNADVISVSKSGIPCGLVSIPQRYMHSNVEMINIVDIENTVKLLLNYAKLGGTNR